MSINLPPEYMQEFVPRESLTQNVHPPFYVWCGYGMTHWTNPGGISDDVFSKGWVRHVKETLKPWLDWAGPAAGVATHLAFGQFRPEAMELDARAYVSTLGINNIANQFREAWEPITETRTVLAYVGNVYNHPRNADLPPKELAKIVRDNLKPYLDAGFAGIILDAGCFAISVPHYYNDKILHNISIDAFVIQVIDQMGFDRPCAIEATARNHPSYAALNQRDAFAAENVFRQCHTSRKQPLEWDGYGTDTSYIKGKIHRVILPGYVPAVSTPQQVSDYAKSIVKDGHIPCVPAWLLKGQTKPSDFLE
jgi:hypothetical protein